MACSEATTQLGRFSVVKQWLVFMLRFKLYTGEPDVADRGGQEVTGVLQGHPE